MEVFTLSGCTQNSDGCCQGYYGDDCSCIFQNPFTTVPATCISGAWYVDENVDNPKNGSINIPQGEFSFLLKSHFSGGSIVINGNFSNLGVLSVTIDPTSDTAPGTIPSESRLTLP